MQVYCRDPAFVEGLPEAITRHFKQVIRERGGGRERERDRERERERERVCVCVCVSERDIYKNHRLRGLAGGHHPPFQAGVRPLALSPSLSLSFSLSL